MDQQFSRRVEELFQSALDLPIAERTSFLETTAAGNQELIDAVRRLLEADAQAESGGQWTRAAASLIESDTAFERYRLLERIGAGGMAVVHKAVRADDEFSKIVAIKQILIPDAAAVERFRRERQMLAGLEHPNIVRMLDGGTGPDGTPFLVMEYVDGLPMDRFVQERKLPAREIVATFRKVCAAVGYAHRNLIVHRDLKPGNILVTTDGEPKVLDFGVAKVMDATTLTVAGIAAMTPGFASPEQVRGGPISTATDIYSLGVLLYQLLTGSRPYRTTESSIDLAKAICEDSPLPMQSVDADLETIVLMALRKEPERRYGTVEQLSEDLGRYLDGYPVAARPDTPAYRARKFIGRNKAALAAAALVLATLAGGIVATVRQAQIANRRFNQVRNLARYFVFDVHDGIRDLPGSTPVRKKLVEKGLEYLDALAAEQGTDRDLQREIASAYEQIAGAQGGFRTNNNEDNGTAALASYRKAAAIREALVKANPQSAEDQRQLASIYSGMGSIQAQSLGDLKGGVDTLRKAVEAAERAVALDGANNSGRNILADCYLMLGDATGNASYQNLGDREGATKLYEQALTLREALLKSEPQSGERKRNLAMAENRMGMILNGKADYEGAFPHLHRVWQIDEEILAAEPNDGAMRINTASANRNLAMVAYRSSHRADAPAFARRARELNEQISRENPNDRGARLSVAGSFYAEGFVLGDDAKAIPLYERSIEMYRVLHRERPQEAVPVGMVTALLYRTRASLKLARLDAAAASAGEILTITSELLAKDPANATARSNRLAAHVLLGTVFERRRDPARAASAYRSALEDYNSLKAVSKASTRDEQEYKTAMEALARL